MAGVEGGWGGRPAGQGLGQAPHTGARPGGPACGETPSARPSVPARALATCAGGTNGAQECLSAPSLSGGCAQGPGSNAQDEAALTAGPAASARSPSSPEEVRVPALAHAGRERRREAPPLHARGRGLALPEAPLLAHEAVVALQRRVPRGLSLFTEGDPQAREGEGGPGAPLGQPPSHPHPQHPEHHGAQAPSAWEVTGPLGWAPLNASGPRGARPRLMWTHSRSSASGQN